MSNLGLWGKNPCVATLSCLPPSLVSPNHFDVLMEVVGAVIILGVGWQDCQSLSHMPTPPMTSFTLLSHVSNLHDYGRLLSRLVFNLHDDGLLVLPLDGRFCSSGWSVDSRA